MDSAITVWTCVCLCEEQGSAGITWGRAFSCDFLPTTGLAFLLLSLVCCPSGHQLGCISHQAQGYKSRELGAALWLRWRRAGRGGAPGEVSASGGSTVFPLLWFLSEVLRSCLELFVSLCEIEECSVLSAVVWPRRAYGVRAVPAEFSSSPLA